MPSGVGPVWVAREGSVSVPIYRVRARSEWSHVVTWSDGGRRRKCFRELAAAKEFARSVARSLAKLGTSSLILTGQDLLAYRRAVEALRPLGVPVDVAIGEYVEARTRLGATPLLEALSGRRPTLACPSVPDLVAELLEAKDEAGRSQQHMRDLRARLARFSAAFSGKLSSVTASDVNAWLRSLGVGVRTARNYLGSVSNLVRFAERRGYLARGALDLSGIERGKTVEEIRIFTPDHLRRLLAAVRDDMVPFLALGAFAGLRTAEIRRLDWSQITPEHLDVRASQAKTRSRRLVPALPALIAWVEPRRREGLVCPLAEPWDILRQASRKSGVEWKHNGMRHSFGSYRLALVKSDAQVALEMGNTPAMIFGHYRAVVTEAQAREWFSVLPQVETAA